MQSLIPPPEAIYNTAGAVAGNVYEGANGVYYLYNMEKKFLGTFNPGVNATYDAYGQFVNYGNQLRALLGV
jgi:hypothetical protein